MKKQVLQWSAAAMLGFISLPGFAHGDEPHGDAPHPAATAANAEGSRFEAATDLFEAVGRLQDGTLTLHINRFATNEPVLQARVELESGPLKAAAAFQADQGSYVVPDGPFVKALQQVGTHAVVLTVTAGSDADLLDGSLAVAAVPVPASRSVIGGLNTRTAVIGAAVLALLAAGGVVLRQRSRSVDGVRA